MTSHGLNHVLELLNTQNKPQDLKNLLSVYLSEDELEMVTMRYFLIGELLVKKRSQREIAKLLETSIATVTRGSNFLKAVPQDVKDSIQKFYESNNQDLGDNHE